MILEIFAVRDRATDAFGNPMFLQSHGQAIRSFTDEVNRSEKDNPLYQHPDDFDLYCLGKYDTEFGTFIQDVPPKQILLGKTCAIR